MAPTDGESTKIDDAAPMPRGRVTLVMVILAFIVLGHGYDIVLQRESWPFSNYPMYAKLIRKKETSLLRLYGIVTDGHKVWEMPIVDENAPSKVYVPPLNELRMKNVLEHAWGSGDAKGIHATKLVLRDYMSMYEERRVLGRQGTPKPGPQMLVAVCKKLTWKLNAAGGTIGHAKEARLTAASAFAVPENLAEQVRSLSRPTTTSTTSASDEQPAESEGSSP